MRLFDSHCHIASERFDEDIADVIARFQEAGGEKALLVADPCEEEPNQEKVFGLIEQYDFLYGAIGVHPHNASGWNDAAGGPPGAGHGPVWGKHFPGRGLSIDG